MGTDKRARQKQGRQQRRAVEEAAARRARQRRTVIRVGALAAIAVVAVVLWVWLGGDDGDDEVVGGDDDPTATTAPQELTLTPFTAEDYGEGECPPAEGVEDPVLTFEDAPRSCIDLTADHVAVFDTTAGEIVVDLTTDETPGTVNNFVTLARYGYYDDTLLHRTDPSIGIIQGGAPTTNSAADPGPGYTIPDEGSGFDYRPGQLVMANRGVPDSSGGQWFFTVTSEAAALDAQGSFVIFGEVVEGLDVLSAILDSHVDDPDNPLGGSPEPPVTVESVTITTESAAGGGDDPDGETPAEG